MMLEAALIYAAQGLRVVPCHPKGKRAIINDWTNLASTDPNQIREWFTRWPTANIGIATGVQSGLLVLDVDVSDGKDGMASLAKLEKEIGPLPRTAVVRTGSGGLHIHLQLDPSHPEIRNSAGKLGNGLDVRAEGGVVIVPPSIHANGTAYEWTDADENA